jgi:hypothetical protein
MASYCSDCGCKTDRGICSNCQEELYILQNQSDDIFLPVSETFAKKAREQKEYIDAKDN